MKETQTGYGILITRKDGTGFLASGGLLSRFIAHKRKDAVRYKRELCEHLKHTQMKVVKVRAVFQTL